MKNSTFAKTALSTLIALSLTACSHKFADNDHTATQSVIKQDTTALNEALTAKEKAETAKAKAEKELQDANANVAKLTKEIEELKKKGQDTTALQKELDEAKADVANKIAQAKEEGKKEAEAQVAEKVAQAKKEAEEKLKPFEREKEYKDAKVPFKVENVTADADASSSRGKFQLALDKFDIKKIFDAKGSVDASDNATMSVPTGTIKIDIDGKEADISVNRHDLAYSSIASMSTQIDTFMMPDWNDVLQQQTAASTVLAVTGQPTDTSKISFADLKAQNKGDLTYEGRAIYAYHVKEKREAGGYPAKLKDAPYEYDIMKSENSWATPTFKVNLENPTISGKMQFGGNDDALKLVLVETAIEEKGNQLQFVGDINATQKRSTTEKDIDGNDITYSTNHVLEKDGKQKGNYQGVFMGPNAEELAGKFVIEQDYKRDDKKDSKYADTVVGKYTQIGNINGVFNAKKVAGEADKTYNKEKLDK